MNIEHLDIVTALAAKLAVIDAALAKLRSGEAKDIRCRVHLMECIVEPEYIISVATKERVDVVQQLRDRGVRNVE